MESGFRMVCMEFVFVVVVRVTLTSPDILLYLMVASVFVQQGDDELDVCRSEERRVG